jgi:hypothetical protein
MSLQTAVDAWTSRYIKSRQVSLARSMGALSPPDQRRQRLIVSFAAAIAAAKRHRVVFGFRLKVKK